MNRTETHKEYIFPQQAIGTAISRAVLSLFGLKWRPRVVRQNRQRKYGNLDHVDYAVPCFELSGPTNLTPVEISEQIFDWLAANEPLLLEKMQFESVSGYVNSKLRDTYMNEVVQLASKWFDSPAPSNDEKISYEAYVLKKLDDVMAPNRLSVTDAACRLIQDMCTKLRIGFGIKEFVNDFSGQKTELVSEDTAFPGLGRHSSPASDAVLAGSLGGDGQRIANEQHKKAVGNSRVICGSDDICENVNNLLDHTNIEGVVRDSSTGATFFEYEKEAVPLRSYKGALYEAAIILYLLHDMQRPEDVDNRQFTILIPQKNHQLIYEMSRQLKQPNRVHCFDALVSKADIVELTTKGLSVNRHFKAIAETLSSFKHTHYVLSAENRHWLLSLIDFPTEISSYLSKNQLPAVFDALNQTTLAMEALTGPELHGDRG
jgi:hypothetical protein